MVRVVGDHDNCDCLLPKKSLPPLPLPSIHISTEYSNAYLLPVHLSGYITTSQRDNRAPAALIIITILVRSPYPPSITIHTTTTAHLHTPSPPYLQHVLAQDLALRLRHVPSLPLTLYLSSTSTSPALTEGNYVKC